jgi:DNA replication protein DnaC
MSQAETIRKMNEMKLFGMARSLEERMKTALKQELSPEELLGFLVDDEYYYRQNNRLRRLLQKAKLRVPQACFEEIDYRHPRKLVKSQMLGLQNKEWIEASQNILLTGPTGIGKSYLASAFGQWSCRQGYPAFYRRWPKLLEELYAARGEGSYLKYLEKLTKVKVLVIDDFGIHALKDTERKDLLEIVEERYKTGATVITSQLAVKHWHEHIGEPTIADAVLDRLLHGAHKIELTGPSMRRDDEKA